jgi:hypothetical protein
MKQDPSYFEGKHPILIYIAKRLKEALRLELLLTEREIQYGVETDRYRGGILFQRELVGAFFYVLPEIEGSARQIMIENGFTPTEDSLE